MSRTIRRKNAFYKREPYLSFTIQENGPPPYASSLQQWQDQERARFHRDHPSGRWNIQKWLRKECARQVKLQDRNKLRLAVQLNGGEDLLYPVDRNDAKLLWLQR